MSYTDSPDAIISQAEEYCKKRGVRLTEKRKQILMGLIRSDKALSAYDLRDICNAQLDRAMPAMTVYRILEFLEAEHLVHKLNLANKYVACAHITCDHAHGVPQFLICKACDKVKEIAVNQSTIADLENGVVAAGFHLVSPQLEMNCICDGCAEQAA